MTIRVCFVCLGNICRSPMAEGVFKHLTAQADLKAQFHIESAGIGNWHAGEAPDPRAQQTALRHGIRLTSTAQQFRRSDFNQFDYVLALDEDVAAELHRLAGNDKQRKTIRLLREFDPLSGGDLDVPDPYYGRLEAFEVAYQMIERSAQVLLERIKPAG